MILDMDKFCGLKGAHPDDRGPDMSPWFRKACGQGAISVQLGLGAYWLREPVEINYGILGVNKSASGIVKDFPSDDDTQGAITVRNLYGVRFANFAIGSTAASQRNGRGTGALLSFIPRSKLVTGFAYDEQVSYWIMESLNLTSRSASAPWPHEAFHRHGFYCDGTYGGAAPAPQIRNWTIRDTTPFGCELDGYSVYMLGASGGRWEGGGITWSGGKAANTRFDAGCENIDFQCNGCMQLEFGRAHHIMVRSPVVEFNIIADAVAHDISGVGHVKGAMIGAWNKPGSSLKWESTR